MAKAKDIESYFDFNLHVPSRTLYVGTEEDVDHDTAQKFLKGLHILESESSEPITIVMSGSGGNYYYGMAIYDAIKECKSKTVIKVYGQAMSSNSIILQAGDVRMASHFSKIMLHYGQFKFEDNSTVLENWAQEHERLNKEMEKIYLERIRQKHPDFKRIDIKAMLSVDTILTAQQAVELGLADKIIIKK